MPRKRVPRELIHSLDVLVNKSRLVEESLAEAVTTKAGAADRVLRLVGCPVPAASSGRRAPPQLHRPAPPAARPRAPLPA
ncbi:hypothetical protein EVAR_2265_1 [Eumeta japonica]|uniref:Uncharacterized protein n=1 Tax=Eumeta variegata TaxID=151549 RepID=A0A4C1SFM5_EUMVA|nr:hypothetical protein EVAR_2265_1 [Eumeta japonica]